MWQSWAVKLHTKSIWVALKTRNRQLSRAQGHKIFIFIGIYLPSLRRGVATAQRILMPGTHVTHDWKLLLWAGLLSGWALPGHKMCVDTVAGKSKRTLNAWHRPRKCISGSFFFLLFLAPRINFIVATFLLHTLRRRSMTSSTNFKTLHHAHWPLPKRL